MSKLHPIYLCWLGIHDWVPERWLTTNRHDQGEVCRKCLRLNPDPPTSRWPS